jgi:hypothetical protein
MSFPYNNTTPASTEAPSVSQPKMLQNFTSIFNILPVDHIGFGNATGGQHKQNTYPNFVAPSAPTGTTTIAFPNIGIADPTNGQYYYINQNATFPLSAVKAFCVFAPAAGAVTPTNAYNIASITGTLGATNQFNISLTPNVVFGSNVAVFVNVNNTNGINWTYTFSNPLLALRITNSPSSGPAITAISVLVVQM